MRCYNCEKDLSDYPKREVEDGDLEEVFQHKHQPDSGFACSQSEYYCSIECAAEHLLDGFTKESNRKDGEGR